MKNTIISIMLCALLLCTACTVKTEPAATSEVPAVISAAEVEAQPAETVTNETETYDADYETLQKLLLAIATDYQPGTAGCSLKAVKLAGQLLDWNAANTPESTRVTETMDTASKLVSSVTPQQYGEMFNDIHSTAIELTKDYALSYMESAGYTPTSYPYDAAAVETFFSVLRAGLGGEAVPFLMSIDPQQPFTMDIDGDGAQETVTVAVDEDKYTTDITIAGDTKTYSDHIDTALMFCKGFVGGAWPGSDGQTLLLFGDEASDDYMTHLYRVHGGELQHAEIYGSVLSADAEGYVSINTVVNVFGTYGADCQYKMNDDFTFSLCSSYAIDGVDGVANGRTLTVICESLPAVKISGAEESIVLLKGTQLLLTDTDQQSYAVLMDQNGEYYRVSIERHDDDWQWYIDGMAEAECFDPLMYAG